MDLVKEVIVDFVAKCSDGNIGAAMCCMNIIESGNGKGTVALQRMLDIDIKGEKIYLIWNDCCNRDIDKTIKVMLEKSKDEILDHIDLEKHDYKCIVFD